MATKTIVSILDDIDGTDGAETVSFAWDGKNYQIDLADKNRAALEKALEPYIKAARSTATRQASSSASKSDKAELDALRAWAKENGFSVSDRGRVSSEIREAYKAAN